MAKLVDIPTPADQHRDRSIGAPCSLPLCGQLQQYRRTSPKTMRAKSDRRGSYTRLVNSSLLILTGASGAGKTTLAHAVQESLPNCEVRFFDSIGVPSAEIMATYGGDYG